MDITYNTEKNGIELRFDTKPEQKIIEGLKAHGFRWSGWQRIWWARNSESRKTFVDSLENKVGAVATAAAKPIISEVSFSKATKENNNPVKIGALFYTSWGYDQTNVDFFQVVKTTNKTITVRKIGFTHLTDGFMSGKKSPLKDSFYNSDDFTCRLGKYGNYKIDGHILFPTKEGEEHTYSYYG